MSVLDKAAVEAMDEREFRRDVLVPLLKAMGYCGVYEFHGGPAELGKDVVGWIVEPLRQIRTSVAIVAKASVPRTNPSLFEVATQVAQALNSPFDELTTGESISVNECWVAINKRVGKETRTRMWATIGDQNSRNTHIYDLDQIWDWVEKYLPVTKVSIFDEAREQLKAIDTRYRVDMSLTEEGRRLAVGEKHPGQAEQEPIEGHVSFAFPETPEGAAKLEELNTALRTGAEAIIPEEYVKEFRISEEIERIVEQVFGIPRGAPVTLRISSAEDPQPRLFSIEMFSDDGEHVELPYVDLRMKQKGSEEMTLTNEGQPIPVLVTMIGEHQRMLFTVNVASKDGPMVATWLHTFFRLVDCLHKPGRVKIASLDYGITLSDEWHQGNPTGDVVNPEFKAMVADLAAIQAKVNLPIVIPDTGINDQDLETISMLRRVLHHGEITNKWKWLTVTADWTKEIAEEMLPQFSPDEQRILRAVEQRSCSLFGTDIPLGEVHTFVSDARLANESEIRAQFTETAPGTELTVQLKFEPGTDRSSTSRFIEWIHDGKDDESANIE